MKMSELVTTVDSIQLHLNLLPKHFRPKTGERVFNLIPDQSSESAMEEGNNDEELRSA